MNYRFFTIILCLTAISFAAEFENMRFRAAKQLVKGGEYEAAIEEYRAILLDEPESIEAYFEAGQVRFLQKRWNAAVQNYKLATERNPEHWKAHRGMAEAYEKLEQKEKAVAKWRFLADKGPADGKKYAEEQIKKLLGVTTKEGNAEKKAEVAPKTTGTSESTGPASTDPAEYVKALELYRQGNWDESLKYLRQTLAKVPGHPGAYYYAGVCRYNLNDFSRSEYNLKKGTKFEELGFNAYYYLGRIREKQNNNAEAIAFYRQYLPLTSNEQGKKEVLARIDKLSQIETQNELADSSTENKDESAEKVGETAALKKFDMFPEHIQNFKPQIYLAQSELSGPGADLFKKFFASIKSNEFNKAMEQLKKLRLDFPSSANAFAAGYDLLAMYYYLGLYTNAVPLGQALLKLNPGEPWQSSIKCFLAEALLATNESKGLEKMVKSVETDGKLGPTSVQKSNLLQRIAQNLQKEKDVPKQLQTLIAQETDTTKKVELLMRLAQSYESQGDKKLLLKTYEQVKAICKPNGSEYCRKGAYDLAGFHYQEKDWPKALVAYQDALKKHPDAKDSPWGMYQLANVLRRQAKYEDAVEAYEAVIKEHPQSYWAEQAKWNKEDAIWRANNENLLRLK